MVTVALGALNATKREMVHEMNLNFISESGLKAPMKLENGCLI
jgi:hypothetical protein